MAFQAATRVEFGCSKLKLAHQFSSANLIRSERNNPLFSCKSACILAFERYCLEPLLPSAQMFHLCASFEKIPVAFAQYPAFLLMPPLDWELACERLKGVRLFKRFGKKNLRKLQAYLPSKGKLTWSDGEHDGIKSVRKTAYNWAAYLRRDTDDAQSHQRALALGGVSSCGMAWVGSLVEDSNSDWELRSSMAWRRLICGSGKKCSNIVWVRLSLCNITLLKKLFSPKGHM